MKRARASNPQGRSVSDRNFYVWDADPKHAYEWGAELTAAQPAERRPTIVVIGLANSPLATGLRPGPDIERGQRWAGDD